MTYSLIGAQGGTHLKIVALALVGSVLVWFTIYSSEAASLAGQKTNHAPVIVAKPEIVLEKSATHADVGQADPRAVCRISTL